MNELPRAARRVMEAASKAGFEIEPVEMADTTRTAEDAAAACGCTVDEIVKSLVFRTEPGGGLVLLLVAGGNRVDEKKAGALLGCRLERADGRAVREATGFAIGGIPPLGHDIPLRTLMDPRLLEFARVWAAAGTPHCVFAADPHKLAEATAAEVGDFTVG